MRLKRKIASLLLVASLACEPAAFAAKTKVYAPPGKAGTSEYSEVVPTAGGNVQPPAMGGGNPTAAQISKLGSGRAGVHKLAKLGKPGAAAAQFAQATAPALVKPRHGLGGPASGRGPTTLRATSHGSALSGIGHLLDGSDVDGIGVLLPLLLVAGVVGVIVLGVLRTRRPGSGAPAP